MRTVKEERNRVISPSFDGALTVSLYDVVEAIADQIERDEDISVAEVLSHMLTERKVKMRKGRVQIHLQRPMEYRA